MKKKQVIVIHGGDTFRSHDDYVAYLKAYKLDLTRLKQKTWKDHLQSYLGSTYDVILPKMPCKANAKYSERKIWFDKFIPIMKDGVVLVGHSLGGIFLAKYLSENEFPKKIRGIFIVAAPFDEIDLKDSLADFTLPSDLSRLAVYEDRISLYHSADDPVVPIVDVKKYAKALTNARIRILKGRGHLFQEKFPEIVKDIKALYK